jgi:hypothetical protein
LSGNQANGCNYRYGFHLLAYPGGGLSPCVRRALRLQ